MAVRGYDVRSLLDAANFSKRDTSSFPHRIGRHTKDRNDAGIPEVVVDGETGLLVDYTPDDPAGSSARFAEAINAGGGS